MTWFYIRYHNGKWRALGKKNSKRGWEFSKTFDTLDEAQQQVKAWRQQLKNAGQQSEESLW